MHTLVPALLGLATGLSLIIAIGAQNAFVLRLGIDGARRLVALVALLCAASDAVLIIAGTLGIGAVIQAAPLALVIVRIVGAGFLFCYGLLAAWRAIRGGTAALEATGEAPRRTLAATVLTTLALTWLNPHVYLDTVIFLGSVANQQGRAERWWWVGGAILASFLWFYALGFGARLLRPLFARPMAWRILDGIIAVVMIAIGLKLALGF